MINNFAPARAQFRDTFSTALGVAGAASIAVGDVVMSAPYTLLSNGHTGYVLCDLIPGALFAAAAAAAAASARRWESDTRCCRETDESTPLALLAMAFDARAALTQAVGAASASFAISVTDSTAAAAPEVPLFVAGGSPASSAGVAPVTALYNFLNRTWIVTVAPSAAFLAVNIGRGSNTTIAVGAVLTVVAGACVN